MRVKDYVTTQDFTKEELLDIVNLSILIKKNINAGYPLNVLYHKTLFLSRLLLGLVFLLRQR